MLTEKQIEGVIQNVLMGEFSTGIFKKEGRDYINVMVELPYDYQGPALCDLHNKPVLEVVQDLENGGEIPRCYQCLEELYYPKNKESQAA